MAPAPAATPSAVTARRRSFRPPAWSFSAEASIQKQHTAPFGRGGGQREWCLQDLPCSGTQREGSSRGPAWRRGAGLRAVADPPTVTQRPTWLGRVGRPQESPGSQRGTRRRRHWALIWSVPMSTTSTTLSPRISPRPGSPCGPRSVSFSCPSRRALSSPTWGAATASTSGSETTWWSWGPTCPCHYASSRLHGRRLRTAHLASARGSRVWSPRTRCASRWRRGPWTRSSASLCCTT